jgi:hypothetical protein
MACAVGNWKFLVWSNTAFKRGFQGSIIDTHSFYYVVGQERHWDSSHCCNRPTQDCFPERRMVKILFDSCGTKISQRLSSWEVQPFSAEYKISDRIVDELSYRTRSIRCSETMSWGLVGVQDGSSGGSLWHFHFRHPHRMIPAAFVMAESLRCVGAGLWW